MRFSISRWSLVAAVLTVPASAQLTWITNPANGSRYALTSPMPWHQAEALATSFGGHLATVRNAAEHDWLVQTFGPGSPLDHRIWIGLTDEVAEGQWQWSSGDTSSYRNWGLFEPDNSGEQDHAALWLIPMNGLWRWCDDQGVNHRHAILEITTNAAFAGFGSGCVGSNGAPLLTVASGSLPRIGSTFQMEVQQLPNVATVLIGVLGASRRSANGRTLPFDLGGFGMPGCSQLVSDDATYFLLALSPTVGWSLTVPNQTSLVGLEVFAQAFVVDPPANALGATVTNGGVLGVGF